MTIPQSELIAMNNRFRAIEVAAIRREAARKKGKAGASESVSAQSSVRQVKALEQAQKARQAAAPTATPAGTTKRGPYAVLKGREGAALVRIAMIADGKAYVIPVKASTAEEAQDNPLIAVPVSKIAVFETFTGAKAYAMREGVELAGEEATVSDLESIQDAFSKELKRIGQRTGR